MNITSYDLQFKDELLGPSVTEDIIDTAIEWLYYFANSLGVAKDDIEDTFVVRELVSAYAFREVCFVKSKGAGGTYYREDSGTDMYGKKLSYYDKRIEYLEARITAQDLVGNNGQKQYPSYRTVRLERG